MKKIFLSALMLGSLMLAEAQTVRTPQPSTTTTVKQEFGLSTIELSYSRPNMKGRKIFGDLVPFNNQVWRTGANGATTLTFGDEVIIGGTKIPAGKYGLLTIPGATEWTVIITKQTDVTSPAAYDQTKDVVRVKAKPQQMPMTIESFTIMFNDVMPASIAVGMMWDKTYVEFPITADIDSKVMAQIDNAMNKDNKPYFQSAMYYMDNGKDLNKANEWFDKAIAQNPTAFWVYHQKANCLAKLGKKSEAIATANKSIELAKAAKNDDYVALNNKLLATLK
jgi:Protein of unknown function (DUF2911)/Tetratricopeptide repeat